jgi:serine phosphatase RsbU (regulator of sigma subunit)
LAGSSFFVVILAIILYRNNIRKQKLYKKLEEKTHIIKEKNEELYHTNEELKSTLDIVGNQKIILINQKSLIEQKHRDLEASINYAKRIQEAILPSQKELNTYFEDFFVFYLPLNVVSGDFYWFADKNEVVILAVADCTGHGVPGAFMSMLGYELLNSIIHDKEIHSPELILNELQKGIMLALKQNDSVEITDGMDISIISLKKSSQNKFYEELLFSGANNPLIYFENNQLIEIKADRKSIGNSKLSHFHNFALHKIEIKAEIMLYLGTDGFQDQFGGNNNKKFLAKRLKNILLENEFLPCLEQRKNIEQVYLTWKGETEQTDDITLIGIKLSPSKSLE